MSLIRKIKRTLSNILFKDEYNRLESLTSNTIEMYQMMPALWDSKQEEILNELHERSKNESLHEMDSQLYDLYMTMTNVKNVSGFKLTDQTRQRIVELSRTLYAEDPVTQFIIELWTDYAVGNTLEIMPKNENAAPLWKEFFKSTRNSYVLSQTARQELSNKLLTDGEFYFVFSVSELDGNTTIRVIPTDEITQIIYDPDDCTIPLYYVREYTPASNQIVNNAQVDSQNSKTVFYRDYRAEKADLQKINMPKGAIMADDKERLTDSFIMPVRFRTIDRRGVPLMMAGIPWTTGYKNFLQDRAAVAKAAATFVEKIKVTNGSQRRIDNMMSRLQSTLSTTGSSRERNPVPAAGATWLENDQVDRSWRNNATGAVDADIDGLGILNQAALSGKVYPHYLGRGDAYRLATASAMEQPIYKSFNRYQNFWSSIWREVVMIVLQQKEKYAQYEGYQFDNYDVDISLDSILDIDAENLIRTINAVNATAITGLMDIPSARKVQKELVRMALQEFGINNLSDVIGNTVDDYIKPGGYANNKDEGYYPGKPMASSSINNPQNPVNQEEMFLSEAAETQFNDYGRTLRNTTYRYWNGDIDDDEFMRDMQAEISVGFQKSWKSALVDAGLDPEAMTLEEETKMYENIYAQFAFIAGLLLYIKKKKEEGAQLAIIYQRIELWKNDYRKIYHVALAQAANDPKLEWQLGATEQHCSDCLKYNGKVKRASYWQSINALPQNRNLSCKGYRCDCRLVVTDKPITAGYLTPPSG